jgi:tRNA (cmo5U34)-methyltransferase
MVGAPVAGGRHAVGRQILGADVSKVQSGRVADHFEKEWTQYDQQIRISIPFYDQALATLVSVAQRSCLKPARILDLGVGTGSVARLLLAEFPDAHLTGIDIVEDFLQIASRRLSDYDIRVSLRCADIAEFEFSSTYDLVVTSFVFHHLTDELKRTLYSQIFASLSRGGCFVNADFVDSGSQFYSRIFDDLRVDFMRLHGWSDEEIRKRYVEHRRLEIPVPMELQLEWLREVGFSDVECFWKYLNLAIFGGRKP